MKRETLWRSAEAFRDLFDHLLTNAAVRQLDLPLVEVLAGNR
jgi:hypothetical protein